MLGKANFSMTPQAMFVELRDILQRHVGAVPIDTGEVLNLSQCPLYGLGGQLQLLGQTRGSLDASLLQGLYDLGPGWSQRHECPHI